MRVLRAHGLPPTNPYRPAKGVRYDGLYNVTGYRIIDAAKNMHRFTLVRSAGQHPIRYQGPEVRPSLRELDEYARIRELVGLSR